MARKFVWMLMRVDKNSCNEEIANEAKGVVQDFCLEEWRGMDYAYDPDPTTIISYRRDEEKFKKTLEECRLLLAAEVEDLANTLKDYFKLSLHEIRAEQLVADIRKHCERSAGDVPDWLWKMKMLKTKLCGEVEWDCLFIDMTEEDGPQALVPCIEEFEEKAQESNEDEDLVLIEVGWHW